MGTYKPFSRRRLRTGFRLWAGRNRGLLALVTLGTLTMLAFETLLIGRSVHDPAARGYLLGIMHAGLVAVYVFVLNGLHLATDREAILHLRGAWGEENTRSELARAKRRRLIWGWVDSLTLQSGDIDHLVLTRSGGLVAIDSKWRNQLGPQHFQQVAQSARRSSLRAQGVINTVLPRERGGHRAPTSAVTVKPLVVIWGGAQHVVPEDARLEDVPIVGGRQLLNWLRKLDGEQVDRRAARQILSHLEDYRATTWATNAKATRNE